VRAAARSSAAGALIAAALLPLPPPARSSPIRYSELSEDQLLLTSLVGFAFAAAVALIGVVGLVRYARQHRQDGRGPAPWKLAALVIALAVGISGLFAWLSLNAPPESRPSRRAPDAGVPDHPVPAGARPPGVRGSAAERKQGESAR